MGAFAIMFALLFVALGILAGLYLSGWFYADQTRTLRHQQYVLQVKQEELDQVQRIDEAFWRAREAMLNEAAQHAGRPISGRGHNTR